jgi:hypothetical protein
MGGGGGGGGGAAAVIAPAVTPPTTAPATAEPGVPPARPPMIAPVPAPSAAPVSTRSSRCVWEHPARTADVANARTQARIMFLPPLADTPRVFRSSMPHRGLPDRYRCTNGSCRISTEMRRSARPMPILPECDLKATELRDVAGVCRKATANFPACRPTRSTSR